MPKNKPISTTKWTHAGLIEDLKNTVGGAEDYVCNEVSAGSRWLAPNTPIPDLLRVRKSYTREDFIVYEIKVSRSDFLHDIKTGKWMNYLPYCSRFYFATPADGVATAADIPPKMGWMVRSDAGWSTRKAPTVRGFTPDYHYVLALLMSESKETREAWREVSRTKTLRRYDDLKLGKKVASIVKNRESNTRRIWRYRRHCMQARDLVLKNFGIDLFHPWMCNTSLEDKIRGLKMGMSPSVLRDLEWVRDRFSATLSELRESMGDGDKNNPA